MTMNKLLRKKFTKMIGQKMFPQICINMLFVSICHLYQYVICINMLFVTLFTMSSTSYQHLPIHCQGLWFKYVCVFDSSNKIQKVCYRVRHKSHKVWCGRKDFRLYRLTHTVYQFDPLH